MLVEETVWIVFTRIIVKQQTVSADVKKVSSMGEIKLINFSMIIEK